MLSPSIIHKPRNLQNTGKNNNIPTKMILKKHEQQSNLPTSRNTRYTHQPHFYQHSTRPFQATQYQRSLMPKDPSKLVRWLCLDRTALWGDMMFESGHTRIFHPPRFPWNFRGFPSLNHYLGEIGRVFGCDEIGPDWIYILPPSIPGKPPGWHEPSMFRLEDPLS